MTIHFKRDPSFFIWVLRPVKIISLTLSPVNLKVGPKREIPEKKKTHLATYKQNLARARLEHTAVRWRAIQSAKD